MLVSLAMRTSRLILAFAMVAVTTPVCLQADLLNNNFQPCFERPQFQSSLREHPEIERGSIAPPLREAPEVLHATFDQPTRSQPLFDRSEVIRPVFDSCQTRPGTLRPGNVVPVNASFTDKAATHPGSLIPRDKMNFVDVDARGEIKHQVPVVSTTCCGSVPVR